MPEARVGRHPTLWPQRRRRRRRPGRRRRDLRNVDDVVVQVGCHVVVPLTFLSPVCEEAHAGRPQKNVDGPQRFLHISKTRGDLRRCDLRN